MYSVCMPPFKKETPAFFKLQAYFIDKAADIIAQKLLCFSHHLYLKHQKSNLIKE